MITIIVSIISFALGFAIGYVAHICKTMPREYIAGTEALKRYPYATCQDNAIYVGEKCVAVVKDAETAQGLVEEMNSL
jgi:hypothetical protein